MNHVLDLKSFFLSNSLVITTDEAWWVMVHFCLQQSGCGHQKAHKTVDHYPEV